MYTSGAQFDAHCNPCGQEGAATLHFSQAETHEQCFSTCAHTTDFLIDLLQISLYRKRKENEITDVRVIDEKEENGGVDFNFLGYRFY